MDNDIMFLQSYLLIRLRHEKEQLLHDQKHSPCTYCLNVLYVASRFRVEQWPHMHNGGLNLVLHFFEQPLVGVLQQIEFSGDMVAIPKGKLSQY